MPDGLPPAPRLWLPTWSGWEPDELINSQSLDSHAHHLSARAGSTADRLSAAPRPRYPLVRLGHLGLTLLVSLHLPAHYREVAPANSGSFAYEQNLHWITSPNIHYHIGIDGISLWLVVLTTFLVPFCVLASWKSIHDRVKEFFILLLVLETAMIGVFIALDLFLFYFFWEATLIPMALIIGIFGHERRVYAAVKFFLYTMIASVFMLAAIIWLYAQSGTFDFTDSSI